MKLKYVFLLLMTFSSLFSGRIALLCDEFHPFASIFEHPNELIKLFREQGHTADLVYYKKATNKQLDSYDIFLSIYDFNMPLQHKIKTILFVLEPRPVLSNHADPKFLSQFHKVFTWNFELVDNKKFFKGFFPLYDGVQPEFKAFNDRKLACLVNSYLAEQFPDPKQLYTARKDVALFYDRFFPNDLTLHGSRGWEQLNLSIYKGFCKNRHHVFRDHKFCYCFENWDNDYHYISEKILLCLQNRCVPIYLGCSNITDYVPENTFIDARKFSTTAAMHEYISNMDEETWLGYIKAIEDWDRSINSTYFRRMHYLDSVTDAVYQSLKDLNDPKKCNPYYG